MTAQEIAAVVGTTPKPWWPYIITDTRNASWFCDHHGTYLTELLFIASMVRWLVENHQMPQETKEQPDGYAVCTSEGAFYGPTLFHALHAACVAAEESK